MVSASGYITEFNRETNVGRIRPQGDESNTHHLRFHLHSLTKNSRRYVNTDDAVFDGELFDFDIIEHNDGTEDEAIKIRHRILLCTVPGCQRTRPFTHRKALDEHIESKHQTASQTTNGEGDEPVRKAVLARKPAKFVVNLPFRQNAVVGRFIGKQGANIKEFQQANKVHLIILTKIDRRIFRRNPAVNIQVKPMEASVDVADVTTKLQKLWQRATDEQNKELAKLHQQRRTAQAQRASLEVGFDADTRRAGAFTICGDDVVRRRPTRHRQAEALSRRQQKVRSVLSLEGHRCAAKGDDQQAVMQPVVFQQKKTKGMKDRQWLVREQLDEL